jgi:glycosyltransferase involved in cell wall biosynthesis
MNARKAVLLLGRRDEPTDGVADYCEKLREAGAACGIAFEIARVGWMEKGWPEAITELRERAAAWRDSWVLLQYTTLAWSRRGFPRRAPAILEILRQRGAHPGVVFHDFMPASGSGIVAGARTWSQQRVLRQLYARSELAVFTVPFETIPWVPARREKAVFIPVGSNFPAMIGDHAGALPEDRATVAVFGITGGEVGAREVADITSALKRGQASGVRVRLVALGRGTEVFERQLQEALDGAGVELSVLGLLPAEQLVQTLQGAQAMLCVRGHVSSRRGSAIAGITCGLPIVGYRGPETGFPITEAGVVLVEQGDRDGLGQALTQVLTDETLREDLRRRSAAAARKYFCWSAIASQFAEAITAR